MERIDVQTHLSNLIVTTKTSDQEVIDPLSNMKTVAIQCLWDNPRLHTDSTSLYMLWKQIQPASPLLKALLTDQTYLTRT